MNRATVLRDILNHKEEISERTAKVYMATLCSVATDLNLTKPEEFTTRARDLVKYMEPLTPVRKKAVLAALLAIVKDKKAIELYKKLIGFASTKVREQDEKQEKSEKQEKNWESWDDVMKTYHELEEEALFLLKKKDIKGNDINKIMNYVILSMYCLIPPRRLQDYTNFKIKKIGKDNNYYDAPKKQLVFNSYKTAKTYGEQRVDAPEALVKVLDMWIPIASHYSDYLIFNGYGEPLKQPVMTRRINEIFGKKISASMLRHIYVSDVVLKDMPKMDALDKVAHDMGQSRDQQAIYKKF
jgi:integrase